MWGFECKVILDVYSQCGISAEKIWILPPPLLLILGKWREPVRYKMLWVWLWWRNFGWVEWFTDIMERHVEWYDAVWNDGENVVNTNAHLRREFMRGLKRMFQRIALIWDCIIQVNTGAPVLIITTVVSFISFCPKCTALSTQLQNSISWWGRKELCAVLDFYMVCIDLNGRGFSVSQ